MIPWDSRTESEWRPQVEIAKQRMVNCLFCEAAIDWSHYPGDWLELEGTQGYGNTCRNCGGTCSFYLRKGQTWHQIVVAQNCPQLFPRLLFSRCLPTGNGFDETCRIAHTAVSWLSKAVQQAAADHHYVEAFQTYSLVFESLLRCAWRFRGRGNPSGTIGQLVGKAIDGGFIGEDDAKPLKRFVKLRNELTHGDWMGWPHYGGFSIGQEVEGHVWKWWFHEDGYVKSLLALYRTWPVDA